MTVEELNDFAKHIYRYMFDEDLEIPIKINNRLKTTLAWFCNYDKSPEIEVSKLTANQNPYIVADTLAHELIHYYLWKNDKPFDDEDIEFKALTYQHGVGRTRTTIIKDGVLKYEYHKHECKCKCGVKIDCDFQLVDNDYRPIIMCPKCFEQMEYNFIGSNYYDYRPTFSIQMMTDSYLKKCECLVK